MTKTNQLVPCQICEHVFAEKHRIIPGEFGGRYRMDNVSIVCPNHHAAIHFLNSCFLVSTNVYFPLEVGIDGKFSSEAVCSRIDTVTEKIRADFQHGVPLTNWGKRLHAYLGDASLIAYFKAVVVPYYIQFLNDEGGIEIERKANKRKGKQ